MAPQAVLETLRQLWMVLHQCYVEAAVVGGLALAAWKHPRTTLDVDVLVVADGDKLTLLTENLRSTGFQIRRDRPVSLGEIDLLQFTYEPEGAYVDVQVDLLLARTAFARESLNRRVTLSTEALGFEVQILGCEDLIMLKLLAGRIIDRADAATLLRANISVINEDLLNSLATRLNLVSSLAEIRREALE